MFGVSGVGTVDKEMGVKVVVEKLISSQTREAAGSGSSVYACDFGCLNNNKNFIVHVMCVMKYRF